MEFLKKSWMKLTAGCLLLAVGVFALLASVGAFQTAGALRDLPEVMRAGVGATGGANYDAALSQANAGAFIYLAIFISCLFIVGYLCMRILGQSKKISGITLTVGSVAALVLFVAGIVMGGDFLSHLSATADAAGAAYRATGIPVPVELRRVAYNAARAAHMTQIAQTIIYTITFAVVPLVFGVKKMVCSGNCGK